MRPLAVFFGFFSSPLVFIGGWQIILIVYYRHQLDWSMKQIMQKILLFFYHNATTYLATLPPSGCFWKVGGTPQGENESKLHTDNNPSSGISSLFKIYYSTYSFGKDPIRALLPEPLDLAIFENLPFIGCKKNQRSC